jgi:serine phosphatase RsbU (regulator of sigma subunit)
MHCHLLYPHTLAFAFFTNKIVLFVNFVQTICMETKIFKGYYRIIYISFSAVFLTALILAYTQFNSRLDYEKTLVHREFQEGISELDRIVEACYYNLQNMRKVVESNVDSLASQQNNALFSFIQNNEKEDYFHLDNPPKGISTQSIGNLTGFGKIEDLTKESQSHINASLSLNPLFTSLQSEVPNVALVYYLSAYKDFMLLYPFIPSATFRLKRSSADRMDSVYMNAYPAKNPQRKQIWTPAYIDATGFGMMVSSAIPIYNGKKHIGIVALDLTLDSLKTIIQRSQRKYGDIFIVNEYNQLLAHPSLVSSADKSVKTLKEALPQELSGDVPVLSQFPERQLHKAGNYYVYYENVPNTDWRIVYVVSVWQTYRNIFADIGLTLFFLLASISAVLGATIIYTRKGFINPSQQLVKHIRNENGNIKTNVEALKLPETWRIWFDIISDIFSTNRQMVEQLKENNADLERKVVLRTSQIQQKQEEILRQHEALQEQTAKITDSLRYAQTIQEAILPYEERMKYAFQDYFALYLPKDIVSGDFYWLSQVKDKTIVAIADCTGHGVPGAFMSMISFALLNEVVNELDVYEPAKILENLHLLINKALKQGENSKKNNTDSIDVGVVKIEKLEDKQCKISFAGAKIPLYYYSETTGFQMVKGNKKSLAGVYTDVLTFDQHEIILPQGAILYMATDGYADQNDDQRRKIGMKDFQQILASFVHESLAIQEEKLKSSLEIHQSGVEQRDDITVLGLKI